MSQDKVGILERALARERAARKEAEKILEEKAAELYESNRKLEKSYSELEALLYRKDSELQGVFENIVDAYVIMDLWGNVLKMNEAAIGVIGVGSTNEELNLMDLVHPDNIQLVAKSFKKLYEEGSLTNINLKIVTKGGEEKLVHINASIIYDNGLAVAAQGIVRDITKEKEAEEQLIDSQNRLSSLISNLDSGVLLEDENRKIVFANKKFCELFQIKKHPKDLKGADCTNAAEENKVIFKNPDKFVKRINEILSQSKEILSDELETVNGKIYERDYIPIIENNINRGHLWTYKDITLRRMYRKSLEAQKQKYGGIIANMNLGLIEADIDDKIMMINHSFEKMSGYTEEELIGKKAHDVFKNSLHSEITEKEKIKVEKEQPVSYEIKNKTKSGEECYWLISIAPNYNLNGEITGSIGIYLDITDLKTLQLQKENLLKELEKSNDGLQEYAHIVSHDLKSPLRSIDALINWIREDNKDKFDAVTLENFSLIETTLEKMELLISDVLTYSSLGAENLEEEIVDLHELVSDLKTILYVPSHISINIKGKLPKIKGDKIKLQQVFQNLISNAIKFIDKEKGLINISSKKLKKHYQFSIEDNGIGIDEKFHEKIFKIFHSLKKSKDSTGIGLSIVKKIVNNHSGKIWLESELEKGTTFHFTLKK